MSIFKAILLFCLSSSNSQQKILKTRANKGMGSIEKNNQFFKLREKEGMVKIY
jgi:hypothetical protein